MSHELICSWLGLPADGWPPDHYRLLGLQPGEADAALIEQRVHQRLDSVRRYQMIHPEQATEVMNRLAQAFVCLTEPGTKKAYDEGLGGRARPTPPPLPSSPPAPAALTPRPLVASPKPPPLPEPAGTAPRDPLVWLYTPGVNGPREPPPPPPPVRVPPPLPEPATEPLQAVAPTPEPAVAVAPPPPAPEPVREPVDPILEAARSSQQARGGIATRRGLFQRIVHTRQLIRLWHRLSRYLSEPERRLSKQESAELYRLIEKVESTLEDFPLLGEAGHPGYLIASLIQFDRARDLQTLTLSQRESLQRDWQSGQRFLEAHRDFLRQELRTSRQRGRTEHLVRCVRTWINDQPLAALLIALALFAISAALVRMQL